MNQLRYMGNEPPHLMLSSLKIPRAHHFTTINEVHPPGVEALGERYKGGGPESLPQPWHKSWATWPQWQQVEDDARRDLPTSVRASGLSFSSFLSSFIIFSSSFPSLSLAFKLTLFSIPLLTFLVFRALSEGREGEGGRPKKCNHGSQAGGINTILRNTNTISILILGGTHCAITSYKIKLHQSIHKHFLWAQFADHFMGHLRNWRHNWDT